MPNSITVVVFVALFLVFTVALIVCAVKERKQNKLIQQEWEQPLEEQQVQSVGARVLSKRTDMVYGRSYRFPEHRLVYYVTFLTDDNKTIEYEVSDECYQRVREYQSGMLITVDGEFFDFGDGEPLQE